MITMDNCNGWNLKGGTQSDLLVLTFFFLEGGWVGEGDEMQPFSRCPDIDQTMIMCRNVITRIRFTNIRFYSCEQRNRRSNQWQFSWLLQLIPAESIHGWWLSVDWLRGYPASVIVIWNLNKNLCMQPNLSASWLFQRAMSAKQLSNVSPDFINELLHVNFQSMQVGLCFHITKLEFLILSFSSPSIF